MQSSAPKLKPPTWRKCKNCREKKAIELFNHHASGPRNVCRDCETKRKLRYAKNEVLDHETRRKILMKMIQKTTGGNATEYERRVKLSRGSIGKMLRGELRVTDRALRK